MTLKITVLKTNINNVESYLVRISNEKQQLCI